MTLNISLALVWVNTLLRLRYGAVLWKGVVGRDCFFLLLYGSKFLFFVAVLDPLAAEVPGHLHLEIEMSQPSKQVQRCPPWAFVYPLCVHDSVVRFSIHSYQGRFDLFFSWDSNRQHISLCALLTPNSFWLWPLCITEYVIIVFILSWLLCETAWAIRSCGQPR